MFFKKERGINITRLFARDGLNCQICKKPLDRRVKDEVHPEYVTFDHIVPLSKGGKTELSNLQLAHKSCNNSRGNADLPEECSVDTKAV